MKIRELRPTEIVYTLRCEPEDIGPIGNCMHTEDKAQDLIDEQRILVDLNSGNQWAWCYVVVLAKSGGFVGRAGLGCCSYSSEQAFRDEHEYFMMLQEQAKAALMRTMRDAYKRLEPYLTEQS